MMKYCMAIPALMGALCLNTAFANPASTDYVKDAINALKNEINQGINALQNNAHTSDISINNKIDVIQNQINELPIITHKIGDVVDGGMVFYVDASRQHGLLASMTDLGEAEWRNGEAGERIVNAKAQGFGAGETNTRLIIAEQTIDQQDGNFAALIAANYQISADGSPCSAHINMESLCYGGWYLPSAYELVLLHINLQLTDGIYWSSTEVSATEALTVDFGSGEAAIRDKSTLARVRAIHTF